MASQYKIQNFGNASEVTNGDGKIFWIGSVDSCLDFIIANEPVGTLKSGKQFTRTELKVMFDKVADKDNWKNPINSSTILRTDDEKELLLNAIEFYTGSKATIANILGTTYKVIADGYYSAIGA